MRNNECWCILKGSDNYYHLYLNIFKDEIYFFNINNINHINIEIQIDPTRPQSIIAYLMHELDAYIYNVAY